MKYKTISKKIIDKDVVLAKQGKKYFIYDKTIKGYNREYINKKTYDKLLKMTKILYYQKQYENFEQELRDNRIMSTRNRFLIEQAPIPEDVQDDFYELKEYPLIKWLNLGDKKDEERTILYLLDKMKTVALKPKIVYNLNLKIRLAIHIKESEKEQTDNKDIIKGDVLYTMTREVIVIDRSTKIDEGFYINQIQNKITEFSSDMKFVITGYQVLIGILQGDADELPQTYYDRLLAFSPNNDIQYHNATLVSTTTDNKCSYETYLHITKKIDLKNLRKNKKEQLKAMFEAEPKDIQELIRKGHLVELYKKLTRKDKTSIIISEFQKTYEDKVFRPIMIKSAIVTPLTDKQILKYQQNKTVVALYSNSHVAPAIMQIPQVTTKKEQLQYTLHPIKNKLPAQEEIQNKINDNENHIWGFDAETMKDSTNKATPFNVTLYGKNSNYSAYGQNAVKDFVDILESKLLIKMNIRKTKTIEEVPIEKVFGFNNANFDNLLIYREIFDRDRSAEFLFCDSSIKYIKWHNIHIYDIHNFYVGSLDVVAKSFKLDIIKMSYPYRFANNDNLNYVGNVPDLKYWNSQKDKERYIKDNGESFNMKEYTEKYCMIDSQLVYKIAVEHNKNAIGIINNRYYDVSNVLTGASMAMNIYSQCFQKDNIMASPHNIQIKEKEAYKGGHTAPYKKHGTNLYYYDINSAHPASMANNLMPFKYLSTIVADIKNVKLADIIPYYLYKINGKYTGSNKYNIPNLMTRDTKKALVQSNNVTSSYHWGSEIIEAIKNDFEINVEEINKYEGKDIFSEYVNYFYNERLKIKKTNTSMANFYKLLLNSLYGKFGQKVFMHKELCRNSEDIDKCLNAKNTFLKDFMIVGDNIMIGFQKLNDVNESVGNLVRLSSYIAALTRCKLSEMMRSVGHENIYYCDTDSIFTSKKLDDSFISETELGKWKLEYIVKEAYFLAPKAYSLTIEKDDKKEYVNKTKGCNLERGKKDNNELVIQQDLINLYNNKIDGLVVKNVMFKRSFDKVEIIDNQTRTIKPVYNKREWINNDSVAFV